LTKLQKLKNKLSTLPIPPLLRSAIGEVPQPFKREEVKQDLIPTEPRKEDISTKDITKEYVDKAWQQTGTTQWEPINGTETHTNTYSFDMNNVKIVNTLFKIKRQSAASIAFGNGGAIEFNIYVNGVLVRTFGLTPVSYDVGVWYNLLIFDQDLFIGTNITVTTTLQTTANPLGVDINEYFKIEGYQF
jgi:hypothetical protein